MRGTTSTKLKQYVPTKPQTILQLCVIFHIGTLRIRETRLLFDIFRSQIFLDSAFEGFIKHRSGLAPLSRAAWRGTLCHVGLAAHDVQRFLGDVVDALGLLGPTQAE